MLHMFGFHVFSKLIILMESHTKCKGLITLLIEVRAKTLIINAESIASSR